MKAAIRRLHSPDAPDLEAWVPPDPECFGILLQVLAGPEDAAGEESFDFVLCTPSWLLREHGADAVIFARNHILVSRHDLPRVRAALEAIVASVSGGSWHEVATQLGRYGKWEFEDYTE